MCLNTGAGYTTERIACGFFVASVERTRQSALSVGVLSTPLLNRFELWQRKFRRPPKMTE
jgi:hypothetical protein